MIWCSRQSTQHHITLIYYQIKKSTRTSPSDYNPQYDSRLLNTVAKGGKQSVSGVILAIVPAVVPDINSNSSIASQPIADVSVVRPPGATNVNDLVANIVQVVANNEVVVSSVAVAEYNEPLTTPVTVVANNEPIVNSLPPIVNSAPKLSTADLLIFIENFKT